MSNDSEFSTRAGHRLLKKQTNKRINEDAGDQLVELLQERGTEVAEQAKSTRKQLAGRQYGKRISVEQFGCSDRSDGGI